MSNVNQSIQQSAFLDYYNESLRQQFEMLFETNNLELGYFNPTTEEIFYQNSKNDLSLLKFYKAQTKIVFFTSAHDFTVCDGMYFNLPTM